MPKPAVPDGVSATRRTKGEMCPTESTADHSSLVEPQQRQARRGRWCRRPSCSLLVEPASSGGGNSMRCHEEQRHVHCYAEARRVLDLRGRGRGAGLRPGKRALRRDGDHLRPHRLRPAHHRSRRRHDPALPRSGGNTQRRLLRVDDSDAAERGLPRRDLLRRSGDRRKPRALPHWRVQLHSEADRAHHDNRAIDRDRSR